MSILINKTEYKKEMKKISLYFNQVIGLVLFTITLTCLGFETPQKAALFSLPIVISLFISSPKGKELVIVRTLINQHDNEEEKNKFLKEFNEFVKSETGFFKSIKEAPMYIYGLFSIWWFYLLEILVFGLGYSINLCIYRIGFQFIR
ncbi:hypothetical protein ACTFQ6_14780 [Aliivibrio fischeri]